MLAGGKFELVPIDSIELDTSNPRIAHYLEHYEPPHSAERLHLALMAGGDDAGTSFNKLKQSVQTSQGIIQPIILNRTSESQHVCIEGNTRVFLYRDFRDKKIPGNWEAIPSIVYADLSETDADAIRLQAHLVGPRQWDPYSKAKYLHHLRNKENLPFSQLVDFCGGSEKTVISSLGAYEDMEKYYRPITGDEDFDPRRFSGFVELQNPVVKQAIDAAGFTTADFARWIHDEKIEKLQSVRQLPAVLKDKKALKVFQEDGIEEAIKLLDRPQLSKALQDADVGSLARALTEAVNTMTFVQMRKLKEDPSSATVRHLTEARDIVNGLLKELGLD